MDKMFILRLILLSIGILYVVVGILVLMYSFSTEAVPVFVALASGIAFLEGIDTIIKSLKKY